MLPQNVLLPAGLRQRDQTQKSPTGPLDREALLQHLEKQALEAKEREDLVPFTGEKKGGGTPWGDGAPQHQVYLAWRHGAHQQLRCPGRVGPPPAPGMATPRQCHSAGNAISPPPPVLPPLTASPPRLLLPGMGVTETPGLVSPTAAGPCRMRPTSPCTGKPFVPKNPTREIPREEQITLEPELEEALANATEAEMCDIAGGSSVGLPSQHSAAQSRCGTPTPLTGLLWHTDPSHGVAAAPQHCTPPTPTPSPSSPSPCPARVPLSPAPQRCGHRVPASPRLQQQHIPALGFQPGPRSALWGSGGAVGCVVTAGVSNSHPGDVHTDEQQAVLRRDLQWDHHQHGGHQQ